MNDDPRLDRTADLLKVLASPNRMRIILLLGQHGELNVSRLVSALDLEQTLLSRHLTKMSDYNMLTSRRQGKEVWYALADSALRQVVALAIH